MFKLLTRDKFRENVFKRDSGKCLICSALAQDVHHIIERKLFKNGGYYLENGASVCSPCHIKAEQTLIPCDQLRNLANIRSIVLPDEADPQKKYDKWLNIICDDGSRIPGPLFSEPGVQKILKPILHLFRLPY